MTTPLFPQGAALIIGGSGGLGAACAQQFALDGSAVAITYNSNEAAADGFVKISAQSGDLLIMECWD